MILDAGCSMIGSAWNNLIELHEAWGKPELAEPRRAKALGKQGIQGQ